MHRQACELLYMQRTQLAATTKIPQPETKRGHELQNERSGLQKVQLTLGGSRPALLSLSGPWQWTGQEKAKRGLNPPKVITREGEAGVGRNVLIHRPTHPLPLISLPEFYSPLYRGGGRGGRAPVTKDCRNLPPPTPHTRPRACQSASAGSPGELCRPLQFALGGSLQKKSLGACCLGKPSGEGEEL